MSEHQDASPEFFTEVLPLKMPHNGSDGLIQDSERSFEHPCLQSGAGFPCGLHCSHCTETCPF